MPQLPTGVLTFLFTDIEGSTSRWERLPEAMSAALISHDALLQETIREHHGAVFKTVGDAFCAAFPVALDALAAAVAIQQRMQAFDWQQVGSLRVRVALYTGEAQLRDDDYFGPPVNRVARLLSAGHGGQILLAETTQQLVRHALPPGTALVDLLAHRLKDLSQPLRIFQLVVAGLPQDFPPLKTLDHRLGNLPTQREALIGRDQAAAEIITLLSRPHVGLVTLTGAGGTGKTTLSLEIGARLASQFRDGVFFVPLHAVGEPELVPSAIAQALGVAEPPGQPLLQVLKHAVSGQQLLLILDNFEHLLAAAEVVVALLGAAPALKCLVTSRTVLQLSDEHEFVVPPLAVPDLRRRPQLDELARNEAVQLFMRRAQAVNTAFALHEENAPAVAAICARLDGIPLALELAAGWIRLLSPATILKRLERSLALLTGGNRDLPERQRTLRGAIDWSYNLLEPAEQVLFRRLSVFVDGWSLEAAEAVCGQLPGLDGDVMNGLFSLLSKSLVRRHDTPEGELRFRMFETIREYALECLAQSGEDELIRSSYAHFYQRFAQVAQAHFDRNTELYLSQMALEHDNLRGVLRWALQAEPAIAWDLVANLRELWVMRGHLAEGRRLTTQALASIQEAPAEMRVGLFHTLGSISRHQGDNVGAVEAYSEALTLYRQLDNRPMIAQILNNLGILADDQDNLEQAGRFYEEALALRTELGDSLGRAQTLVNIGELHRRLGAYERAASLYEEALALCRRLGHKQGMAFSLLNLSLCLIQQGDYRRSEPMLQETLLLQREIDYRWLLPYSLDGLAHVALLAGAAGRAAVLIGGAQALRQLNGMHLELAERPLHERLCARVLDALGEPAFEETRMRGWAMSFEELMAFAGERVAT